MAAAALTSSPPLLSSENILLIQQHLGSSTVEVQRHAVRLIGAACHNNENAFSLLKKGVFLTLLKCPSEVSGVYGVLDTLYALAHVPQSEKNEESRKAAYARMEDDISTFNKERIAGSSWFSLPFFSPPPPRGVAFLRNLER